MDSVISVSNLAFSFPDGTTALKGVSAEFRRGAKIALMGANGAGKSTLMLHLNAIHLPRSGVVRVDGLVVCRASESEIRRHVGLVFQDPDDQVFSPTVWDDVCFGPANLGLSEDEIEDRAASALTAVGMFAYRSRSPQRLSHGQKKRVAIAGVLAMRPLVVAMDEPMAGLDPQAQSALSTILDNLHVIGTTLVVSTHDVDWAAEWADDVIIMRDGAVLAQGPVSLLLDREIVTAAGLRLPRLTEIFHNAGFTEGAPRTAAEAVEIIRKLRALRLGPAGRSG